MGCNESRQKETPPTVATANTVFPISTPLPLYLYEEYARTNSPGPSPITSPTNSVSSSNKSISPKAPSVPSTPSSTSSKRSLSIKRSSSLPKTSKAFQNMSTARLKKLSTIAYYKFNKFHKFSKLVQEEILLHIDKELRSME